MKPTHNKTTSPGQFFAQGLCAAAMALAPLAAVAQPYPYNQTGDKNYVVNTVVSQGAFANNQSWKVLVPRAAGNATFTSAPITVDGVREAAWDAATAYPIANKFLANMTATAPAATTEGTLRLLWDGPVLYVLVEVTGDSTPNASGTPNWNTASYTPTTDGLVVYMDVFNDQWGMENDCAGVFFLGANPALTAVTSFNNTGIPSLGSFFHPSNLDYSTRLKAFKSSGYNAAGPVNYTYEFALQIEGWGDAWERVLTNGTQVGLEIGIFNQGASFTWWSKTDPAAAREASSNLPNSERPRNRDWGVVTMTGWDEVTPQAYSGWRADEDIRFWNSKCNPGGTGVADSGDNSAVWTGDSKALMVAAKNDYLAKKAGGTATRAELEAAVQQVCQAFTLLTWADTRFPDPRDLPAVQTLPNAWKFFDPSKGTGGMVTNLAEWAQRKEEIKELAQFYEYGFKPKLGVDYTVSVVSVTFNATTGNPTVVGTVTPTNANWTGGVASNVSIAITLPAAGTVPAGQKAVLGFSAGMTANGIANIGLPTGWGADIRTDANAWGNGSAAGRAGTFYTFFPYKRNSTFGDVSYEMATATGVSVMLDILEQACAQNAALNDKIDPTRAITKGFSINGKLAFIAAVYDDRVKAVVAGGAGATGPANWRYNCTGQEYSFIGTPFWNAGADLVISHGTEGPGNSYRHNRVRETELFRHFMDYGHMYSHEEGSYGYGRYSRLPFDNALLVACLAPDRSIMIDTNLNDYNDGAVTDNLSLQVAKFVYKGLRTDPEKFIKFNSGNYASTGDPHGAAPAAPEGRFYSDFFYGTATQTPADVTKLAMDPYALPVSGPGVFLGNPNPQTGTQTPYDYYWGGFNTITGGTGGVTGTNGWYSYYLNPLTATRGGFLLNRRTNQVSQQVTVKNTSTAAVKGPVYLVLDALSGNTTLVNGAGMTGSGKPYYVVAAGDLAAGASVTFTLIFTNPTSGGITYNPLTPPSI